ncbi:MAG: efflux RND transporter permease subunit [Balneolaceae bacterium]|nr:efflux RND transporter permease subunit [Balneolaceae bacterium]
MNFLADYILRYPRTILLIFAVIVVAAVYPALQIRTDFNLENFFPREDPSIEDYQYLEQEFGRDDNVIMVGFHSDSLLSKSVLSDLKAITDSAEQIDHINEVRSLWSAEKIESDGINLRFDPYLDDQLLNSLDARKLRELLSGDPFIEGSLINETADVTAFYLEIDEDRNNYDTREEILGQLDRILEPYNGRYHFRITGIPYYRNQYVHFLNREIVFYIILSSLLIAGILWMLYRSLIGLVIPMLIVWFTILFTLALMHLTGGYFEVMSSTIAPILLSVGIADSVHMLTKFDDARSQGLPKQKANREMLITLGSATLLTSFTTAIGFGSLVTSNIVPMQRFGIYTAAGVLIAYLITIHFLPASLSLSNVSNVFKDKSTFLFRLFSKGLERISSLNRSHYKTILLVSLLITIGMSSGIYFLKVNGKVFDELGRDTEPIQDADFFARELSPPFPMEIVIDTGNENGVTDPVFLQQIDSLAGRLQSFDEVEKVISFNTLMKEVHEAMAPEAHGENPLPLEEQLIAQYLLLMEINQADLLERVTDFSYRRVRVSTQVQDVGSYRINALRDTLKTYLDHHFPDSRYTITGSTILSADLNNKIVSALFKSIFLAIVLVSLVMALLFRDIRLVVISLIPNILPLLMIAGFMGYVGIDIKASTAVIFTIAFGIAVDDSIHYLARLRVEMRRGKTLYEALPYTTQKTGKAIVVTSLILLAGFGSLLTSVFISTVYMGLLVSLTILIALFADVLMLPSLFYWIRKEKVNSGDEKPLSRSVH